MRKLKKQKFTNKTNNTLTLLKQGRLDPWLKDIEYRRIPLLSMEYVFPQMNEIMSDRTFYNWCLVESELYKIIEKQRISTVLMWIVFMSNEKIVKTYNKEFNKGFLNVCPMSDIKDLYTHMIEVHYISKRDCVQGLKEIWKLGLLTEIDNDNFLELKNSVGMKEVV